MKTGRTYSTQKTYTTYSIENANFTPMFNRLNIFTQVVFVNADVKNHKYTASLSLWRRVLHVENNYLYRLRTQFNADKSLIIQTINNIINCNLTNVDLNTKLTFNNETKTLTEWSKQTIFSPQDCLYVYYTYGSDVLEKILFANTSVSKQEPKQIINNEINNGEKNNDKNSSNKNNEKNKNDNDAIINWKSNGKLITYNNITNNRYGWTKLITGITHEYAMILLKNNPNKFFNKLKIKPNTINFFQINDIYATYEQWSLFINKPRTYLEDMIMSMGRQYTYNFLYTTIVNNTDFITKKKLITINNESNTLFGWARKINQSASHIYYLSINYGLDYTIKYIKKKLYTIKY